MLTTGPEASRNRAAVVCDKTKKEKSQRGKHLKRKKKNFGFGHSFPRCAESDPIRKDQWEAHSEEEERVKWPRASWGGEDHHVVYVRA